ncbi:DUF2306 domain-containing protein [Albitalea terrae]|uniref:DUF2306 domain-containing protein n=1 Tax=Piscinibacter terrae TaxID=2496871 RepID=A0A3N7HXY9_9BURK|nr:DUF2306 domain-containing protein [Albitalea terrae]
MQQRPLIALHLGAAMLALVVGGVVMARRKGTINHKRLGWFWVALMTAVAVTSVFIRDHGMPNIAGYTPIHALTLFALVSLPRGIHHIRQGNVAAHRGLMKGLFIGGCIVAGLFTLVPGRILGDLLWKQALGLVH